MKGAAMGIAAAKLVWLLAGSYALAGAASAAWMLSGAIKRIDPQAATAPWRVKLIIAPGIVALWPVMAAKMAAAERQERTPP